MALDLASTVLTSSTALLLHESAEEKLQLMKEQEEGPYKYDRYLMPPATGGSAGRRLHAHWREKICQWTYNVVDHYDLSREVVAVSMDLFDRYLATKGNKCTGNMALLASLTTLYIAMKLNDSTAIKVSTLASLSRGQFGRQDIEDIEWDIVCSLNWRLNPPTLSAFAAHMLQLLPNEVSKTTRRDLFEFARYHTELAVCDSYFVPEAKSAVAYAAILNGMDTLNAGNFPATLRQAFMERLGQQLNLTPTAANVVQARKRLNAMFRSAGSQMNRVVVSPCPDENQQVYRDIESMTICSGGGGNKRGRTGTIDSQQSSTSVASVPTHCRADSLDGSWRYSPSPVQRHSVVSPMNGYRHRSPSPLLF